MEGHTLITSADDVCASSQITLSPKAPNDQHEDTALKKKATPSLQAIDVTAC